MTGRCVIRFLIVVLLGVALAAPASPVAAQATPEGAGSNPFADLGLPQLDVTMTDTAFEGMPAELESGRYVITFTNATDETAEAGSAAGGGFLKIPDGMTADEFIAVDVVGDESTSWFYEVTMAGGPFALPGQTTYAVVELSAGNWIYWAESPEAPQPVVEVTVTGELPADLPAPEADVRIEMSDHAFSFSDSLTAGTNIIELANVGMEPHFMLAGAAPAGTTAEAVMGLLESLFGSPEGAAAATPASSLAYEDIREVFNIGNQSAGVTAWYTITVEPGTHVAICLVPDQESGVRHAMLGMIGVFEIGE